MVPTIMVLRLVLISTSNTVSFGTVNHISAMNFNNSQQGSGGSDSANAPVGGDNSSAHVEGDEHRQTPVIDLTKDSITRDLIGQSLV